jgi:hypothetical protein
MRDEILAQFWGAFFAAGFAIITFAVTRTFSNVYQRNKLHYNFLVKLEAKLNRHLAHVFSIVYIIEGVRQTTANGNISFNNLDAVMLEPVGDFHNLVDIDLINDVFSYDTGLEMLTSDLTNLSATYSEFRSALITKQITMSEFQTILPNLPNDLKHLVRSWEEHLETTTDLLVQTRIMIRRDKKRFLGLNWLFPRKLKALTQRSIKTEKLKLQQEVEEIRKQSQKRIEKINGTDY